MRRFQPTDFPDAGKPYPIVEVFGYDRHLPTQAALDSFNARACPFAGTACEKYRQYGFGYCSVTYQTAWDQKPEAYAVCDHRLDGSPVLSAVSDFFGPDVASRVEISPEVKIQAAMEEGAVEESQDAPAGRYSQSFDFVAVDPVTERFVGIEAQAIDLRGGGVGPAFAALLEGRPAEWRSRFTEEAQKKGRRDTIAYGVNTANIFKRLGLQVALKGAVLHSIGGRLYVVTQHRPFAYMAGRSPLKWTQGDDWDITFLTFDYTGRLLENGQHEFAKVGTFRIGLAEYAEALVTPRIKLTKQEFLAQVKGRVRDYRENSA